jgi:flagellar basal-body rod modification protein FlgD
MTTPISPIGSTNSLVAANPGGALDKEDFLQLLVTQLRHQDPLNPMDGTQFASQLAEFSALEQLIQVNKGLSDQMAGDAMTQLALRTNLAASLIGHDVMGFGGQIAITGSGSHSVTVDVGGSGGIANIEIIDELGNTVASRSLGVVHAGAQQELRFALDGVPPGKYRYQVTVLDEAGSLVPVEQFTVGKVAGIFFDEQGIGLRLESGLRVNLDDLAEIEPAGTNGE